jgi:hypothetical protein
LASGGPVQSATGPEPPDLGEEAEEPDGQSTRILEKRFVGTINVDKSDPASVMIRLINLRGAFPISDNDAIEIGGTLPTLSCPGQQTYCQKAEQLRTRTTSMSDVIGLLSTIGGDTAALDLSTWENRFSSLAASGRFGRP